MDQVLHESPLGILTFDFEGRIDLVNPSAERMLQLADGALKKQRLTDLQTPLADAIDALTVGQSRIVSFLGQRKLPDLG